MPKEDKNNPIPGGWIQKFFAFTPGEMIQI